MPSFETVQSLRTNKHADGTPLTKAEREAAIRPFLPSPRAANAPIVRSSKHEPSKTASDHENDTPSSTIQWHRPRIQPLLALLAYKAAFIVTHMFFSLYMDCRRTYHAVLDHVLSIFYYHHRTPELIKQDVKHLKRLPKHLSVIIDLGTSEGGEAVEESLSRILGNVADISTWCTCAGIPKLSVYEKSGILKTHIPAVHRSVMKAFKPYFPPEAQPTLSVRAPHHGTFSPPAHCHAESKNGGSAFGLSLLLLSASDGRETLVDLTKTLTEMAQSGKIQACDISVDLIDAEVTESSCGEPDLLVLMAPSAYHRSSESGPRRRDIASSARQEGKGPVQGDVHLGAGGDVCLRGYPPWQVRLTEIFHVQDNQGVSYQLFRRALYSYAKAEKRFGR